MFSSEATDQHTAQGALKVSAKTLPALQDNAAPKSAASSPATVRKSAPSTAPPDPQRAMLMNAIKTT
jgi:hypothetical protein